MTPSPETARRGALLIIDDDALLCESLSWELGDLGVEICQAQTGESGLAVCRERVVDVVLLDQNLPDASGVDLCRSILEQDERTKIVFMTAFPSFDHAVAALRAGASDYLAKPFELGEVRLAVERALRLGQLERIEILHRRHQEEEIRGTILVGRSPQTSEMLRLADLAAASTVPVLISGETGTGKTLLARYVHYAAKRASEPFVSLNCAALPESLAESELFGHEKGAFTGAASARRGIFEMAEAGTVLLDEIGSMTLPLQAKLLGVLEDSLVRRIGSETQRRVNARVIAATNVDLDAAVERKEFRRDLFYRLCVLRIHIPPLRERLGDLPELCRHLTTAIAGRPLGIPEGEMARLTAYHWPGNVRELRNVLERALLVQGESSFSPSVLIGQAVGRSDPEEPVSPSSVVSLEVLERTHISNTLSHFDGNLSRSARALGIALSTLKRKLRGYGLSPTDT